MRMAGFPAFLLALFFVFHVIFTVKEQMLNLFKQIADYFSRKPREPRLIGDDGYIRKYETDGFFGKSWTEMYILYECFRLFPEELVAACAGLEEEMIKTYSNSPIAPDSVFMFGNAACKTAAILGHGGTIGERCARFLAMLISIHHHDYLVEVNKKSKYSDHWVSRMPADVRNAFRSITSTSDRADWLYKNYCLERLTNAASAAR
jgi:hypothetical protein